VGLSVKVQCMDLDLFSLNPHSVPRREHIEAGLDSVGCSERIMVEVYRMPLSSANSPVVVKLVVNWFDVYRLNERGAATAPYGSLALMICQIRLSNIVRRNVGLQDRTCRLKRSWM